MSRSSYKLPWNDTNEHISGNIYNNHSNNIHQTYNLDDQPNDLSRYDPYANDNSRNQQSYYAPSGRSTTMASPQIQIYQKPSFTSPVSLSNRKLDHQQTNTREQEILDQYHQDYQLPQFTQQTLPISPSIHSYEYPGLQQRNILNISDQRTKTFESSSFGVGGILDLEPEINTTNGKYNEYPMTNQYINSNYNPQDYSPRKSYYDNTYQIKTSDELSNNKSYGVNNSTNNKQLNNSYTTFYPKRPSDHGLFEVNNNQQDKVDLQQRYPQNRSRFDKQLNTRTYDNNIIQRGQGNKDDKERSKKRKEDININYNNTRQQQYQREQQLLRQKTEPLEEQKEQQQYQSPFKETVQSSQWSHPKKSSERQPNKLRFEDTLRVYNDISQPIKNHNKLHQSSFHSSSKRTRSHTSSTESVLKAQQTPREWLKQVVMKYESDTQKGQFTYESFQQLCQQLGFNTKPQFSSGSTSSVDALWNLLQYCCPSSSGKVLTQLLYQILQLIIDRNRQDSSQAVNLIKTLCLKHRNATVSADQLLNSNEEESTVLSALIRQEMIDNLRDSLKEPVNIKDNSILQKNHQHPPDYHTHLSSHSNETHYVRTQLTENDDDDDDLSKSPPEKHTKKNTKINTDNIHTHGVNTPIRQVSREQYLKEESVHRRLFCDAGAKVDKLTDYLAAKDRIATQQMAQCTFKPVINKNTSKLLGRSKSFTNQIKHQNDQNSSRGIAQKNSYGYDNTDGSVVDAVKGARDTLRRMEIARKQKEYKDNFWENERNKYNVSNSKRMKKKAMEASRFNVYSDNEGDYEDDYQDYYDNNHDREGLNYNNEDDSFTIRQNSQSNRKISPGILNRTPRKSSISGNNTAVSFRSPVTQRYTPRQSAPRQDEARMSSKRHRSPMLYVDVNISKHRRSKLAIYEGDQPEIVAEEFAKIYSLQEKAKKKLVEKLTDVLEQFYESQYQQQ